MPCVKNKQDLRCGWVAVDVETTGLYPKRGDRIIEIGAVSLKGGIVVEEFHSLINVSRKISKEAQKIHGITNEMLAGEPLPEQVFPAFHAFMNDSILVGHNVRFDMSFLRAEFHRLGLGLANGYRCTLALSRKRFPDLSDYSLASVYRHLFGVLPDGIRMHRALDDARMTAAIWIRFDRYALSNQENSRK